MNFLILGDGPEERAWAMAVARQEGHHLHAAFPNIPEIADLTPRRDLDDALATAGVEAVIVGGAIDAGDRAESLRRVAAEGLRAVCLHPPGPDSEAYYQISMSRAETGAVIVPDLPTRLHPGVQVVRQALEREEFGTFRELRYEATIPVDPPGGDLVRHGFARAVDIVRSLLGEIEAVTATGDPPGLSPSDSLVVQLRAAGSRRAEVRLRAGPPGPARLSLLAAGGELTLELPAATPAEPSRLTRREADGSVAVFDLPAWDPHEAMLAVLADAAAGRHTHPDLADGTRAMEVTEGVVRSLRRGRTVDLYYEEISEAGTFKSVMTSVGCLVLLSILVIIPLALAGPALGMGWTIYLAYVIPPMLVGFVLLQALRFAIRDHRPQQPDADPT
jgi:myo-inositol 2-dehydrogenase/D-chiro-inositol 1-dehydrogenase